jgi:hypothetical protein
MASRALLRLNPSAARSLTSRTPITSQSRAFTFALRTQVSRNTRPISSSVQQRAAPTIPDEYDIDTEVLPAKAPEKVSSTPYGDTNPLPTASDDGTDWSRSFQGLSTSPFPKEISDILLAPVEPMDIEIKPGQAQVVWYSTSTD